MKAINDQINLEAYSAYVYLAMAAYFDDLSLDGCSSWLKIQAKEELSHMMKFYEYLVSQNQAIVFQSIKKPSKNWETPLTAFSVALGHEQKVTAAIHHIMDLAIKHNDHRTKQFLLWFVEEQIEEEQEVQAIVDKIKLIREESSSILLIDKELKARAN
eukprot:COSAG01_NODE_637_length_14621_cov_5040.164234_7_plen_158_part_00